MIEGAPKAGFAVIYRWRVRSGMEERFQRAWAALTEGLVLKRGALGSRLHRAEDGTWVAYAQWPTRRSWERSRALASVDPDAVSAMGEATERRFEPILLRPVCDRLVWG